MPRSGTRTPSRNSGRENPSCARTTATCCPTDLAKRIVATAARAEDAFRAFVVDADRRDAGLSAETWLGHPLEHLVIAMLGHGDWRPDPSRWREGVEGGQFRG